MRDIYFMKKACFMCDKSSCLYKVGCVAVKDGKIVGKSFNETLKGERYCQDGECVRKKLNLSNGKDIDKVCTSHAEITLIAHCAKKGISLRGCFVYVTTFPCYICTKALIQAGVKRVYYMSDYAENTGLDLFRANNVLVEKISEDLVWG